LDQSPELLVVLSCESAKYASASVAVEKVARRYTDLLLD
jgi:hypothetical protein